MASKEFAAILYRLRDGVDADAFERFVHETDLPSARGMTTTRQCLVLRILDEAGSESRRYCEFLEVTNWADFESEVEGEELRPVFEEWERYVEPSYELQRWVSVE